METLKIGALTIKKPAFSKAGFHIVLFSDY